MGSVAGVSSWVAGGGLVTAFLFGGCAMLESPVSGWNPPPTGSTFVRQVRDTGSWGNGAREEKVTVGRETWNGINVVTFAAPKGKNLYTPDNRLVAILNPAGKAVVTWDPPDAGHGNRFPLDVGKTWSERARMTMPDGRVAPHENDCRVETRELVNVPAGTFESLKVRCTSPRGLEITSWYVPELGMSARTIQRRSASNPFGGAGTREEELVSVNLHR